MLSLFPLAAAVAATAVQASSPPPQTPEAYEAQIRRDAAADQALRGPLDGAWVIDDRSGRPVFEVRIVDPGTPPSALEAAWRDLRRKGPDAAGFVDLVARDGPDLMFRFDDRPGRLVVITVKPGPDGSWSGRMWRGRQVEPVDMQR